LHGRDTETESTELLGGLDQGEAQALVGEEEGGKRVIPSLQVADTEAKGLRIAGRKGGREEGREGGGVGIRSTNEELILQTSPRSLPPSFPPSLFPYLQRSLEIDRVISQLVHERKVILTF